MHSLSTSKLDSVVRHCRLACKRSAVLSALQAQMTFRGTKSYLAYSLYLTKNKFEKINVSPYHCMTELVDFKHDFQSGWMGDSLNLSEPSQDSSKEFYMNLKTP